MVQPLCTVCAELTYFKQAMLESGYEFSSETCFPVKERHFLSSYSELILHFAFNGNEAMLFNLSK